MKGFILMSLLLLGCSAKEMNKTLEQSGIEKLVQINVTHGNDRQGEVFPSLYNPKGLREPEKLLRWTFITGATDQEEAAAQKAMNDSKNGEGLEWHNPELGDVKIITNTHYVDDRHRTCRSFSVYRRITSVNYGARLVARSNTACFDPEAKQWQVKGYSH